MNDAQKSLVEKFKIDNAELFKSEKAIVNIDALCEQYVKSIKTGGSSITSQIVLSGNAHLRIRELYAALEKAQ